MRQWGRGLSASHIRKLMKEAKVVLQASNFQQSARRLGFRYAGTWMATKYARDDVDEALELEVDRRGTAEIKLYYGGDIHSAIQFTPRSPPRDVGMEPFPLRAAAVTAWRAVFLGR